MKPSASEVEVCTLSAKQTSQPTWRRVLQDKGEGRVYIKIQVEATER
jgi:hypothetical protein